jgi:beta-glucanase (GH16 family)
VFADHFNGTTLNQAKWSTCQFSDTVGCTNPENNELEWYQSSQVKVHDGTVSLTVIPKKSHGKQFISGIISSHGKFSFEYGYVQIVAKLPKGMGLWSAFWTAPENGTWPPEIDILENWAQSPNVNLYIHFGDQNHFRAAGVAVPSYDTTFHVYGVNWTPRSISWYVDGKLTVRFNIRFPIRQYLIADLAVNGRFPPNGTDRYPQSFVIRSIEVWEPVS